MACCRCKGFESEFSDKVASKDLKRYREKGPRRTTRILLDALKAEAENSLSLLDIGGGVGAIQHELLGAGVSDVTNVEASNAYIQAAKEEAKRRGHTSRFRFYLGDFVDLAADIPSAGIVTLDRVICCYQDVQQLVDLSTKRANKFYGLVYPRSSWWVKLALLVENLYHWLTRCSFRVFSHPTEIVDALARNNGLKQRFYHKTVVWQVVVYAR